MAGACVPVATVAHALKPGAGTVQVFTPEQSKALVAYVQKIVGKQLPHYDTVAVMFLAAGDAIVFVGNKGNVCIAIHGSADQARAVIKGALGEGEPL